MYKTATAHRIPWKLLLVTLWLRHQQIVLPNLRWRHQQVALQLVGGKGIQETKILLLDEIAIHLYMFLSVIIHAIKTNIILEFCCGFLHFFLPCCCIIILGQSMTLGWVQNIKLDILKLRNSSAAWLFMKEVLGASCCIQLQNLLPSHLICLYQDMHSCHRVGRVIQFLSWIQINHIGNQVLQLDKIT